MNRKLAPLFILSLGFLNACGGGGGSSSGGGGGGGGPQPISVTFAAAPPASMTAGSNVGMSANVANDSKNQGVNWSCTPTGTCGTFNPTSTASGSNTVYTAPSAGGTVTLTAASVTDTTKTATAQVTITAPPPPAISVSISTAPAATVGVSGTTTLTATVMNDTANAGVNWSCTPTPSCGSSSSFSPNPAPSGTSTTYTAPSSVPSGGTVTLIATSVTDTTKSASTNPILITGTASLASLSGQYAFIVSAPTGNPTSRGITTWVGSIAFDGAGNILTVGMIQAPNQPAGTLVAAGGEEDLVSPRYYDTGDPILPTSAANSVSKYTVDSSGHGTLVISTYNGETLHINFVVTSVVTIASHAVASHAVIIELDGEPGSGSLDLQTPATGGFSASQVLGTYSFTLEGVENAASPPFLSFGGVFSAGSSVVSGGTIDVNAAGLMHSETINAGSSVSAPDVTGRGTLTFVGLSPNPTRTFVYYIVSGKVLRLLENDGQAYMGGSAYSQGSPSTTLAGNYAYQYSGWNPAVANPPTGRTVAAGQFSVSSTSFSGFSDANTGAAPPTTTGAGLPVSGSYTVSSSTTEPNTLNLTLSDAAGVPSTFNAYLVDPTLNILDPNNTSGGGGALLLHTDGNINGTGIMVPQQTSTSPGPLGNYALNLNNSIATATPNELDLVGVILSANGNTSQVLGGGAADLADYDEVTANDSPPAIVGGPLSGAFTVDGTHPGRATGSFTVAAPATAVTPYPFIPGLTPPVTFKVAFYQVSNSLAFIVENDSHANVSGYLVQQQLP